MASQGGMRQVPPAPNFSFSCARVSRSSTFRPSLHAHQTTLSLPANPAPQRRIYQTSPCIAACLRPAAHFPRDSSTVKIKLPALRTRPLSLQIMATARRKEQPSQQQQSRGHAGHAHHHAHDNAYLTSTDKNDAGVRITRVGLYVNLGMAVFKGFGGYVFNSKALLADAIHSLTDLVSDIMTLATVSFSLKPPSERFPSGYGKVESLGSLGVSGILLAGGIYMGWAAVLQLFQQFVPGFAEAMEELGLMAAAHGHGHGHGHGHSHTDLGPNINAAWLAAGSIAIKEWLYRASKPCFPEDPCQFQRNNADCPAQPSKSRASASPPSSPPTPTTTASTR